MWDVWCPVGATPLSVCIATLASPCAARSDLILARRMNEFTRPLSTRSNGVARSVTGRTIGATAVAAIGTLLFALSAIRGFASEAQAPVNITTSRFGKPVAMPKNSVDQMHMVEGNLAPPYPMDSRAAGEEGLVVLDLTIDTSGKVIKCEVVQSSGFKRLDLAGKRAAKKWRFKPHMRDGKAVEATFRAPIRWSLNSEKTLQSEKGVTLLFVAVDATGRPRSVTISRSSGDDRFDAKAREAARHWRFKPKMRDGVPVDSYLHVPVRPNPQWKAG